MRAIKSQVFLSHYVPTHFHLSLHFILEREDLCGPEWKMLGLYIKGLFDKRFLVTFFKFCGNTYE